MNSPGPAVPEPILWAISPILADTRLEISIPVIMEQVPEHSIFECRIFF